MKLMSIVTCLLLLCNAESAESEVSKDAGTCCASDDNDDYSLYEDTYDDSLFFRPLESSSVHRVSTDLKIDCLGLGETFSSIMDAFLKKEENGTNALKSLFHSVSRNQPKRVTMRHGNLFSMDKIDFDIRRRTIFIVHGYFADGNEAWIKRLEEALLQWSDVNIFVVEWGKGSSSWNYLKSTINTRTVGDQMATFIGQLVEQTQPRYGPDTSNWGPLHLIGHSLGSHICGYASHQLKLRGIKWPVHRITGLDPAQPCFRNSHPALRLDHSDASFVDIIHTNGRFLKKLGLGLPYPLGHVDFYPNGGSIQPGCMETESSIWSYIPLPIEMIKKTICSHRRSYLFFTESIATSTTGKNCSFWAYQWDMSYSNMEQILSENYLNRANDVTRSEMGINAENHPYNGTYFVVTGRTPPFCKVDKSSIEEVQQFLKEHEDNIFS